MIRDPIVEEVRAIKEELAARFDFDIRKIVEDAQSRQASACAVSFQRRKKLLQPNGVADSVSRESTVPKAATEGER